MPRCWTEPGHEAELCLNCGHCRQDHAKDGVCFEGRCRVKCTKFRGRVTQSGNDNAPTLGDWASQQRN